jgi:hypothetical protein
LYGYEIARRLELPENDPLRAAYKDSGRLTKPKLLLDDSPHLEDLRKELMDALQELKADRVIEKDEDAITHLIACFLGHTKDLLEKNYELNEDTTVEMTFCVPVCWSARANATMSACAQKAMKAIKLGTDGISIPHMFMVNEAEAAAMYALHFDYYKLQV